MAISDSNPSANSGLRDNHSRGKAGDFLRENITPGSVLSFVSAYFTVHAYARRVFVDKQGGWFEVQPRKIEEFPIPNATADQKLQCEAISRALIFLHRPEAAALPNHGLMVSYFEQWLNGLVYELFFPGELHARNLYLFDITASIGFPADPAGAYYAAKLQLVFECAHDLNNPLRAMLADLQTIEEVRIIEGGI